MKKESLKTVLIGTIKTISNGSAIVFIENTFMEDVLISKNDLNGAFNHDQVEIQINYNFSGIRTTGKVLKIIKRFTNIFVGRAILIKRRWYLKDEIERQQIILLQNDNDFELEENSILKVEITDWKNRKKQIIGKIINLLAHPNDSFSDLELIAGKYNISKIHSNQAVDESFEFNQKSIEKEIRNRYDYQYLNVFTIDPENAKDFDDALSIEYGDKYNTIGIHIADVSHFIYSDSYMDREAMVRGNSYYFTEKSFPMLPKNIANNICSLKPDTPRLTLSLFLKLDSKFNIISYEFKKCAIKSNRRYNYTEVDKVLIGESDSRFKKQLLTLKNIAESWRKKRFIKGGVDLDFSKIMFSLDKSGVPSKFKKETNTLSHQIVEECMLMANKITANELNNKAINSIFRNHKEPSHNQVSKLLEMINALGIKKNFNQDNFSSQNLNIFIKSIKNSDKSIIAKYIILRSFKKAHYNSKNEGHFGLGFENYTHFTSPIRRYSDLMIHRLLKNQLFKETIKINSIDKSVLFANEGEKRSMLAERAYNKLKLLRWMKKNDGNSFNGIITKFDNTFIHVQIIYNGAEGLINIGTLPNDIYVLSSKKNTIIGKSSKNIYKVGDKVNIIIKKVDIFENISIFQISNKNLNNKKWH